MGPCPILSRTVHVIIFLDFLVLHALEIGSRDVICIKIYLFKFYVLGNGSIELYQYCMYNSFDNKLPSTQII